MISILLWVPVSNSFSPNGGRHERRLFDYLRFLRGSVFRRSSSLNLLRAAAICAKRSVNFAVILGILICSQGFHSAPVEAAPVDWCSTWGARAFLPGTVDVNTSHVILADAAGARMSHDALNRTAKHLETCKPGPDREAAAGYLNSWQGILLHRGADDRWREKMNLANQQLASCIVHFHGTDRAATCETRLQTNVRLKATWEISDAQTDP